MLEAVESAADRRRLTVVDRGWFQRKSAGPQPYYSENRGHTRGHNCGVGGGIGGERERGEESCSLIEDFNIDHVGKN